MRVQLAGSRKWFRSALVAAGLAALMIVALPTAGAFAKPSMPPGGGSPPRSGTGPFVGIYAWGNGAAACARHQNETRLYFDCSGVQRNFIGSYVLIRFPSKNYRAVVHVRPGDPRMGVQWSEQDTTVLTPIVYTQGVVGGDDSVTLTGASLPNYSSDWDLGLDAFLLSGGIARAPVNVTISITPL